jgi:hypothetical protein
MPGRDARYCGKPCKYTIERGEDGVLRRVYSAFCERHLQQAMDIEYSEEFSEEDQA